MSGFSKSLKIDVIALGSVGDVKAGAICRLYIEGVQL